MAVVNAGATIFQANKSKLRRPLDTGFARTSGLARERVSAVLDRQELQVAAPIDLRKKKRLRVFSPQLIQSFWQKLKEKNPEIVVMSPTFETKDVNKEEMVWQQYHLCLGVAEHQSLGGKHFLI